MTPRTLALPLAGLAALVALALGGCGPTPEPDRTPSASATPAATATPRSTPTSEPEPEPRVATIVLRTETLTLLDEGDAVVATFSFLDEPAPLIALLTEAFGADPAVSLDAGSMETPTATIYEWGGFTLWDQDYVTPRLGFPNFLVIAEAPAVSGVALETLGGVHVGSSAAEVAAIASAQYPFEGEQITEADPVPVPDEPDIPGAAVTVSLWGTLDDPAQQITAPVRNYGN